MSDPLLQVEGLSVAFRSDEGGEIAAVRGVDVSIARGQAVGLVGESGSGKSTAALAPIGLLPANGRITGGRVRFDGQDLLRCAPATLRRLRGRRIAVIFQDPMTSLNPYLSIVSQLGEGLRRHLGLSPGRIRRRCQELLEQVGIAVSDERLDAYPHEFSGGQRQRILIAMALACDPDLLIADEPTTALDVTVQAQVLALLKELQERRQLGLLLVTHDMGVVAGMCDEVCVMRDGRFVERAPTERLYVAPEHPYTRMLLGAVPRLHGPRGLRLAEDATAAEADQ